MRYVDPEGRTWLSSRDGIDGESVMDALLEVTRAMPPVRLLLDDLVPPPWPEIDLRILEEMERFPGDLEETIRERRLAFPMTVELEHHRRCGQVVGNRQPPIEFEESFFSIAVDMAGGGFGALLPRLDDTARERVAGRAIAAFLARSSASPGAGMTDLVLGPDATAVLLHEVAAHGLEVDLLALTGNPEGAIGFELGAVVLDLIDDPSRAPEEVKRTNDDEGLPVSRRFLLRAGVIEQPLCDRVSSLGSRRLVPGAGRRGDRNLPPLPRCHHLELAPGSATPAELVAAADQGVYAGFASGGSLDPLSGTFSVELPFGRQIVTGQLATRVGRFELRGQIADLLRSVAMVGNDVVDCGAGWCAKGGQKVPVWASAPSILLRGVEIAPGRARA